VRLLEVVGGREVSDETPLALANEDSAGTGGGGLVLHVVGKDTVLGGAVLG